MRLPMKTGLTTIALSVALQGCMFSSTPAPIAELPSPMAAEQESLMSDLVGPADLEGAIIQAQTFRRAGDLDGATRTLSQLVLVAPDDPRVLGEYGKTLVAKEQTEDAIAFLNRAIELNPSEWTFYSAQGVAFDQAHNYRAANIAYQRALAIQPGEPSVLSNAGLSRMQAGDLANAETLLNRAIEQGGTDPRIARNLAMVSDLAAARAAQPAPSLPQPTAPGPVAEAPDQENIAAPSPAAAAMAEETLAEESAEAPIPGAVERSEIPAPAPAPRIPAAVQALVDDPTVSMQRLPDPDPAPEPVVASVPVDVEIGDTEAESEAEIETQENETAEETAPPAPTEQVAAVSETSGLRRLTPNE